MPRPLNLLIVEDSQADADLMVAELRRADYAPAWKRVETETDFLAELNHRPDLILSDYSLPRFSGLRAAELLQASGLNIPFILISGTVGEDVAVEAMRHGATDYLLKDRMARLGPAVERALREKHLQDEHRQAADEKRGIEEQIRLSLQTQAAVLNALPAHIALIDPEGVIVAVNDAWRHFATANQLHGPEFGLGQNYLAICERAAGAIGASALATATGIRGVLGGERSTFSTEYACHSPTERRWFQMVVTPLRDRQRVGAVVMHVNITERKQAEAALRETEERYRALFDRSMDCVFLNDFAGNFLDANQASLDLLGYRREDIPTLTFAALLTEDQLPLAFQATEEIKRTGHQKHPTEYRLRCKDGRQVYVETQSSLTYREGKPFAIQGIARDLTERRRAQELLFASEQRLNAFFTKAPAGLVLLDKQLRFVQLNETVANINGLPMKDHLGKTIREVLPKLASVAEPLLQKVLATGERILDVELSGETSGQPGVLRYWLESFFPILGKDDSPEGIGVIFVEITERKQAEEALRRSQERYVVTERAVNDGLWEWNILTDEDYFSPRWKEIIGFRDEEFPNQRAAFLKQIHPEVAVVQEATRRHLELHERYALEFRLRHKDGGYRWVFSRGEGHRDETGRAIRLIGAITDITERKLAEAKLRESEADLAEGQRIAKLGSWRYDIAGNQVRWTDELCRIIGIEIGSFDGKYETFLKYVLPEDQPRVLQANAKAVDGGMSFEIEYRIQTPGGDVKNIREIGYAEKDAGGKVMALFGTAQDITESKQSEIKVQRANRALQMLSHCNEALVRTASEPELLSTICRIVVDQGGYRMAWVGYAREEDFRAITPVAQYGDDAGYLAEIKLSWDENHPAGKGPAGRAIRSGHLVFSADAGQDADFYWQAAASKRGYRGVICLPLRDAKRTFGLLGLYSAEILQPNEEEFKLLQELAEDLAFGIGHLRSERERQQAEERIAEQAALLDQANDSIILRDLNHRPLYWNRGAERLFGWGKEEVLGNSLRELLIVDQPAIDQAMQAVLQNGEWVGELAKKTKSNKHVLVDSRWTLVRDEAGQPKSILTIETDITERKRALDRLHLQSSVLTAVDNAILITDPKGMIEWVNPAFTKLTGYSQEEALGKSPRILKSDQHPPAFFANLWATITTGNVWHGELVNQRQDGKQYSEDMTITPVRGGDGQIAHFVAIKQDVTERRSLERQLRQAQKMEAIGTLAGGIAHDFNNMLGAMFGFGHLLQQDTAGNPAAQESIAEILNAANRAKELVQQILTFSRQRESRRQVIRLDPVVKEAMKFLRASLPAEIKIKMDLASNVPTVLADPTQIYQVTMNLATNALHAMQGRAGQLTVTLESFQPEGKLLLTHPEFRPIQYARLAVADNGHGMDAKTLEHIFEPFFTTKPVGQGTGLGLAVVHGIVKSHEGIITVESQLGQGTTFTLYFPAQTSGTALTDAASIPLPKGARQRILLLDDEAALTTSVRRLLERLNYHVTTTNHPLEAVSLFAKNPAQFELVLTDLSMPEMNGIEVAQQIRAVRPELPVILMSGFTTESNHEHMAAAGIRELLEKPVSPTALAEALERTFAQSPNQVPKLDPGSHGGADGLR